MLCQAVPFLRMDGWKVNVRGEDALARGSLSEDVLEFVLKVLRHVLRVLDVPVAVTNKTVGREIAVQETPKDGPRVLELGRCVCVCVCVCVIVRM